MVFVCISCAAICAAVAAAVLTEDRGVVLGVQKSVGSVFAEYSVESHGVTHVVSSVPIGKFVKPVEENVAVELATVEAAK